MFKLYYTSKYQPLYHFPKWTEQTFFQKAFLLCSIVSFSIAAKIHIFKLPKLWLKVTSLTCDIVIIVFRSCCRKISSYEHGRYFCSRTHKYNQYFIGPRRSYACAHNWALLLNHKFDDEFQIDKLPRNRWDPDFSDKRDQDIRRRKTWCHCLLQRFF